MERGGRLTDLLAVPAGELLANRLDHLPLPRHDLECIGDVFAQLHDAIRPAAIAPARRFNHDPLARQVIRKLFARWFATGEARDGGRVACGLFSGQRVFGRRGFEFLELQLELVQQARGPFGRHPVLVAAQLGDLELEFLDHRFRTADGRANLHQFAFRRLGASRFSSKRRAQSGDFQGSIRHANQLPCRVGKAQ